MTLDEEAIVRLVGALVRISRRNGRRSSQGGGYPIRLFLFDLDGSPSYEFGSLVVRGYPLEERQHFLLEEVVKRGFAELGDETEKFGRCLIASDFCMSLTSNAAVPFREGHLPQRSPRVAARPDGDAPGEWVFNTIDFADIVELLNSEDGRALLTEAIQDSMWSRRPVFDWHETLLAICKSLEPNPELFWNVLLSSYASGDILYKIVRGIRRSYRKSDEDEGAPRA